MLARATFAAMLLLSPSHAKVPSQPLAKDDCASAFLTEHSGPRDAAIMLTLWNMGAEMEPLTSGATDRKYDIDRTDRVASRFLELRGQFQIRCPSVALEFE